MNAKSLMITLVIVGLLMLLPLVAMQFTNEVNWSTTDFVVMGALLIAAGFIINLALVKAPTFGMKALLITAIIIVFILVWMELAVGIFGTSVAGN